MVKASLHCLHLLYSIASNKNKKNQQFEAPGNPFILQRCTRSWRTTFFNSLFGDIYNSCLSHLMHRHTCLPAVSNEQNICKKNTSHVSHTPQINAAWYLIVFQDSSWRKQSGCCTLCKTQPVSTTVVPQIEWHHFPCVLIIPGQLLGFSLNG